VSADDKIHNFLVGAVAGLVEIPIGELNDESELIGNGAILNSRNLVTLLLEVEEFLDDEYGADFNWYSDSAMSDVRSRLRTIGTLKALIEEKARDGRA
jgi:hypothetical protein